MNKKTIYVVLGIILLAIGIYVFVRNRQVNVNVGNTESPIKNSALEGGSVGNISFTGNGVTPPSSFNIYKNSETTIENLASQIAVQLGLKPLNGNNLVWLSNDKNSSLSVDTINKLIEYSTTSNSTIKPDLLTAKTQAVNFIRKFNLGKNISEEPSRIQYLAGDLEVTDTTPDNADIIALYFSQKIDGFPLFVDSSTFSDLFVWVGGGNQVIKADFPQRLTPTVSEKNLTSISFDRARSAVESKKGSIVSITIDKQIVNNKVNLGNVTLSDVSIEYRLDSKSNTFYPFYRFDGLSTIKDTGQDVSVVIITPAVAIP